MADDRIVRVGVIGCGHWGPNHVRVFTQLGRARVEMCADVNPSRLAKMADRFSFVRTTADHRAILSDETIDAVVIATPTETHAEIVRDAIAAGKHILVEKPLCTSSAEARDLTAAADRAGVVLMVGHVFLYNPGIMKLREYVREGELGRIHYLDAVRTNLGPVRGDVNALVDLGTHDISIFNYLLDAVPQAVAAQGSAISQEGIEDVCFATLLYPDGTLGHIHVSWLNPRKVRTLTVVGQKKMADWDDVHPTDTVRLYDKGLDQPPHYDSFGEFHFMLRHADVRIPRIEQAEPLVLQAEAFLDSVLEGAACRSGGREAEAVVAVLEAAQASLHSGGGLCPVGAVTTAKSRPREDIELSRETVEAEVETSGPWGETPSTAFPTLSHWDP